MSVQMQIDFCQNFKAAVNKDLGPRGIIYLSTWLSRKRCLVEVQHELYLFKYYSQANVCGM